MDFCQEKHWEPLTERQLQNELKKVMADVHRVGRSNDLVGPNEKTARGFRGVRLQD
jgi:hypothetical protein